MVLLLMISWQIQSRLLLQGAAADAHCVLWANPEPVLAQALLHGNGHFLCSAVHVLRQGPAPAATWTGVQLHSSQESLKPFADTTAVAVCRRAILTRFPGLLSTKATKDTEETAWSVFLRSGGWNLS